ncbi:macro domain-containing protein [Sandaracinus amylolyticus]|uniref:macro domain-containing protein n=1 Tax=Sandaracinus amylolyticus TaxID=927083 RepID=UPI001F1FD584|nr:macro domain-containing protein [Sandaracinus amylolyticus]UJR80649.1 O-acetyl-ADP-ribose deacetylase (Regulator of RNase III), contains Macro domain [Sandaracinus amylolyticus]
MLVKVVLCDVNPKVINAWRATFEENPEVEIVHGSMLDMSTSAWVSPTNSAGRMDGGLDLVIKNYLGVGIEKTLQRTIKDRYTGRMPVGHAACTPTERVQPRFLISTPTMVSSSEDISATMNVALACAAAFQAVHIQNTVEPGTIRSVALPGLGANTGRVPAEICADLMWTAYDLFREHAFTDFAAVRQALESILGDLGPTSTQYKQKAAPGLSQMGITPSKPTIGGALEDFDDSEFEDDEDFSDDE